MKKIMLSLAMALVSVCASAQVYIGGTAGISSNKIGDGDSKTAYSRCCTETVTMLPRNRPKLWASDARSMGNKCPAHGLSMPITWSLSAHPTSIERPTNGLISKRYQQ